MNIVKIQDKPQREIRPTDIYAYKPQKEAYFHSKDFILDSVWVWKCPLLLAASWMLASSLSQGSSGESMGAPSWGWM